MAQRAFIVIQIAHRFDFAAEIAARNRGDAHSQIVDGFRRDADARSGDALLRIGVHRKIIHAHVILGGRIRKNAGVHRMAAFQRFSLARRHRG